MENIEKNHKGMTLTIFEIEDRKNNILFSIVRSLGLYPKSMETSDR